MDIKNLELSEADFKMLADGMDSLKSKDLVGELLGMMFEEMLGKDNPEEKKKMIAERKSKEREKAIAKEALIEEIQILQGKLLMLKRYFIQNNALTEANEIISSH